MSSSALALWLNERLPRLNEVDGHCAAVESLVPPNEKFLEELLRGYVLHLSAHFQGYCRDLYTECAQQCIAMMPAGLKATAQAQFSAHLALGKGNPSYDNIKRDFNRFGFTLDLQTSHPNGAIAITKLSHLNDWRNKAAHQGTHPLGTGVPMQLSLAILREWRSTADTIATSLDAIMQSELTRILGQAPW